MTNRRKFFCYLALAVLALTTMSPPAAAQEFQGRELEKFLSEARFTAVKRIGQGVTDPERATLELNGTTRFGVWKIIDEKRSGATQMNRGIEIEFQDSWRTEIAAYEIDKILGLGMVPATVERSFNGKKGSVQYWVESKMPEAERVKKKISPPNTKDWNEQMFKVRLFDNLIYNNDRHLNNLLVTEDFKLRLIDHSRAFRPFNELKEPKTLQRFSRSLLAKLRELNEPMLQERVGEYLTIAQIRTMLRRRDVILKLADELVKQKGEAAVLYPE